jgi:hypothetical protein
MFAHGQVLCALNDLSGMSTQTEFRQRLDL